MAKARTKDARVSVRIPAATRTALEAAAEADRRTMSDMLVILLDEALAKRAVSRPAKGTR